MGKTGQVETVRQALAYGALGFGALAMFAPRAFAGLYGLRGDGNLNTMIRLWGTRTTALGALNLVAEEDSHKRVLAATATALNVADSVFIATAGSDVAVRSRVMGTLTTLAFAGAGAYVLTQD
jgi:hypothetical protein